MPQRGEDGIDWTAILTALDGSVPGVSMHGGGHALGDPGDVAPAGHTSPQTQTGLWDHLHRSSSGNGASGSSNRGHNSNSAAPSPPSHPPYHLRSHSYSESALYQPRRTSSPLQPHGQGRAGLGLTDQELFAHFAANSFTPTPSQLYGSAGAAAGGHWGGGSHSQSGSGVLGSTSPRTRAAAELNDRISLSHSHGISQADVRFQIDPSLKGEGNASTVSSTAPSPGPSWRSTPSSASASAAASGPASQSHSTSATASHTASASASASRIAPAPSRPPPRRQSRSIAQPPPSVESSAPTPGEVEDLEDKRVRNTLASARFRAKKKHHVETVERNIRDLEAQHRELEVEVNDLRKENGLLKEMVQLKYGAGAG